MITMSRRHAIGYTHDNAPSGLVFDRQSHLLSQAKPINVSRADFQDWLSHGALDLAQPADWFWLQDEGQRTFICVTLNRSMAQAAPLTFFLDVSAQRSLYFYAAPPTTP